MRLAMDLKLLHNLRGLGFTENEAKAYLGLLSLNEATAREIHEFTNIPRPKIYGVLDKMEKKGYVKVRQETPTRFRGIAPEELTRKLREEYLISLKETLKELESMIHGFDNRCF